MQELNFEDLQEVSGGHSCDEDSPLTLPVDEEDLHCYPPEYS